VQGVGCRVKACGAWSSLEGLEDKKNVEVEGTRLTAEIIVQKIAFGETIESIRKDYPFLTEDDIRQLFSMLPRDWLTKKSTLHSTFHYLGHIPILSKYLLLRTSTCLVAVE